MSSLKVKLSDTNKLLSSSECFEIVRETIKRNDFKIDDVEIYGDKSVFGFLGEYFRLIIHIKDELDNFSSDQPKRLIYFIKSLPIDNELKRKHIECFGMFKKEWFMYSELLPKFRSYDGTLQWRPNCYLARPDLIVLDDLTELGYSHLEYRRRFSSVLVKCCLRNVAKLHADSISYVENILQNEKFEVKFKDYLIENSITEDGEWFLCGLRAIVECAPLAQNFHNYKEMWSTEEFHKRIKKTYEIVNPSSKFRNVLCHQDLWANNIMFKFEKKPNSNDLDLEKPINSVFMDYQFYRYAPPAIDVLQLLLMTTRLDHRRQYYEEYFKYYHSCLSEELMDHGFNAESILPWKEFRLSCDELRIYPLIYNCVSTPMVFLSPEKQLKMKNTDPEKFQHILLVDRVDYMLEAMENDKLFKDVVMENIEELLDFMFGDNLLNKIF